MHEHDGERGSPPSDPVPEDEFAALDAREEFFTGALQHAHRVVNAAEAVRLHLMLAGLEAMLLEEQAQTGLVPRLDDPVVKGFFLHQADELRTTRFDVEHRLTAARLLRDRLPRTWAVFLGGLTTERGALAAADQAVGLSTDDQYAEFDEAAAEVVQEERPTAIARELAKVRERLESDSTIERHRSATNRRYVRARQTEDGQGVLEIHSTAADIAAAYDRIRKHAVAAHGREGECRTLGNLMVDAALDAILTGVMRGVEDGGPSFPMERLGDTDDPSRKLIDATILVLVPAETGTGAADRPAAVAGMGVIDPETARTMVAHTRTWTRVLVDPVDDSVLGIDSTERYIPAGLKKLLHCRQPTCGCGCGLPAHRADVDHVVRVEHDGRTRHHNLQILCRASHRLKDAGFADVTLLSDGSTRWRDRWGGTRTTKPAMRIRTAAYPEEAPF